VTAIYAGRSGVQSEAGARILLSSTMSRSPLGSTQSPNLLERTGMCSQGTAIEALLGHFPLPSAQVTNKLGGSCARLYLLYSE
jgi:hypothetical protein